MPNKKIGTVTHFYTDISVGIIELEENLKVGDTVKFEGSTTDFEQEIKSMQYDHKDIEEAKKGREVGVKVEDKVKS
jgi:putative protease